MSIGITGHQRIDDERRWPEVERSIGDAIERWSAPGDIAYSSLAVGADQRFARIALEAGRRLHVVIPCRRYEETFDEAQQYRELLAAAAERTELPFDAPSEEAFEAAGRHIADAADVMIAVWNGKPAAGRGGTGDIVEYARRRGIPVHVIDPRE